ncbi:hypothetical protein [Variovorax sp. H27-G14]
MPSIPSNQLSQFLTFVAVDFVAQTLLWPGLRLLLAAWPDICL